MKNAKFSWAVWKGIWSPKRKLGHPIILIINSTSKLLTSDMSVNHRPESVCLSSKRLGNKLFRLDIFKKEDRRKKIKNHFSARSFARSEGGERCVCSRWWKLKIIWLGPPRVFVLCLETDWKHKLASRAGRTIIMFFGWSRNENWIVRQRQYSDFSKGWKRAGCAQCNSIIYHFQLCQLSHACSEWANEIRKFFSLNLCRALARWRVRVKGVKLISIEW